MQKSNVISLDERRKQKRQASAGEPSNIASIAPVFDMTIRREEVIKEERRKVKRTILAEFIGAFVLLPGQGLLKVNVFDISEDGLSIDMEYEFGHFEKGEEFAMRLYLSKDTYLPFIVRVSNFREVSDEGAYRHGVQFVKDTTNAEALKHFVKFLETVTASLQTDRGDIQVKNIR
jgi:PilZ domain